MMTKIEVFTDGSATTANKPGGWAYVLCVDGEKHSEGSGHAENVSNNDMELEAAIQGLAAALKYVYPPIEVLGNLEPTQAVLDHPEVTLCSDSQIVLGWASGSYRFKQENKLQKYKQLQFLVRRLRVKTQWIKGHSGNVHNERCDRLANNARKNILVESVDKVVSEVDTKIGTKKIGVVSLWYQNVLKIVDFENGIIENYDREAHGKRGSVIEIREGKER
jgi:ribonuclease HI